MKKKILNFNYKRVVYCSDVELWATIVIITVLWAFYRVGLSNIWQLLFVLLFCFGVLAIVFVWMNRDKLLRVDHYFSKKLSNSIFETILNREVPIFDEKEVSKETFFKFLNRQQLYPLKVKKITQFFALLHILENSIDDGDVWVRGILRAQAKTKKYYDKNKMKCIDKGENKSREYMNIIKDKSIPIEQKIDAFLSPYVVN